MDQDLGFSHGWGHAGIICEQIQSKAAVGENPSVWKKRLISAGGLCGPHNPSSSTQDPTKLLQSHDKVATKLGPLRIPPGSTHASIKESTKSGTGTGTIHRLLKAAAPLCGGSAKRRLLY